MKNLLLLLILVLTVQLPAAALSPKFDAISRLRISSTHKASRSTVQHKAFITVAEDFDVSQLDLEIIRRLGNVLLVRGDIGQLENAASFDGVLGIALEKKMKAANEHSAIVTGADKVAEGSPERTPFTGKNVLAGLFDTGFDVQNPSFRDADGNSRIEYLFHYPEMEGEPLVYDAEALKTLETEDADNYHGTHVLGTIAGRYDGRIERALADGGSEIVDGGVFSGMATDAAIAIAAGEMSDVNIIDGLSRIIDHAKDTGRPCVLNLSIADNTGPHDGSDPLAASLSELANDAVIVMSAGNYASNRRSITKVFNEEQNSVGTFLWPVWWSLNHVGILAVWSGDSEPLNLKFQFADNDKNILLEVPISSDTEEYIIVTDDYSGGEGRPQGPADATFSTGYTDSYIAIITDRSPSGRHCYYLIYELHRREGVVRFPGVMVSGREGQRVDMYLSTDWGELLSNYMPGYEMGGDDMTISSMAAAHNTVSVGAWTGLPEWPTLDQGPLRIDDSGYTYGTIARFSSFGTLIDGRQLPTTTAPGASVISVYSTPYHETHPEDKFFGISARSVDSAEPVYFTAMYGTSMSSPVVAGAIAQWLEADPELSSEDVLEIINATSTVDDDVLACPERWGAGRFNALAGLSLVLERKASVSAPTVGDNRLTVLRRGSSLEIFIDGAKDFDVCLYTTAGTLAERATATGGKALIDTSGLAKGVYIISADDKTQKIII